MEQTVYKWLRALNIHISKKHLFKLLKSHPNYPSLLSITDVLDGLSIGNVTAVIDKDKLNELDTPILAHMQEGHFQLFSPRKAAALSASDQYANWDGIILAAEPTTIRDETSRKAFAKQQRTNILLYALLVTALTLSAITVISTSSLTRALLILSDINGIAAAVLIVRKDMGIADGPERSFCMGKNPDDCNAVIRSTTKVLPSWIRWSDAGLIYFIGHYFLLSIPAKLYSTTVTLEFCRLLSAGSMLFVAYSIYYQWGILRKWCFLCLVTCALLCFQFFCLSGQELIWTSLFTREGMIALFLFSSTSVIWLLVRPMVRENIDLRQQLAENIRFKNDVNTFLPLLKSQRSIDPTPFAQELEIGAPNAPIRILVGCNPYCNPCAQAHTVMHRLAERFDGQVSIVTRFTIWLDRENDKKNQAVASILAAAFPPGNSPADTKHIRKVLDSWFKKMNAAEFCEEYGIAPAGVPKDTFLETMKLHEAWAKTSDISFTPTIFINGHELPDTYSVHDLPVVIQGLINDEAICANKVNEPGTLNPGRQVLSLKTLQ